MLKPNKRTKELQTYSDDQVKDKFTRLKIFFKEGLPYEGWDKYSEINLIYNGQVVCRKRRKDE